MVSKVTSRWQTTIPKEVRKALNIKPSDSILYIIEEGQAIIKPVRGNILNLRGAFSPSQPCGDFSQIRELVKETVGQKAAGVLQDEGKL